MYGNRVVVNEVVVGNINLMQEEIDLKAKHDRDAYIQETYEPVIDCSVSQSHLVASTKSIIICCDERPTISRPRLEACPQIITFGGDDSQAKDYHHNSDGAKYSIRAICEFGTDVYRVAEEHAIVDPLEVIKDEVDLSTKDDVKATGTNLKICKSSHIHPCGETKSLTKSLSNKKRYVEIQGHTSLSTVQHETYNNKVTETSEAYTCFEELVTNNPSMKVTPLPEHPSTDNNLPSSNSPTPTVVPFTSKNPPTITTECSVCHVIFTQSGLSIHEKLTLHNRVPCHICGDKVNFKSDRYLKFHLKSKHTSIKCPVCSESCEGSFALKLHMKSSHIKADSCSDQMVLPYPILQSLGPPTQHTTNPFYCPTCSQTFSSQGKFNEHLHYHEFMDFSGGSVICNICKFSSTSTNTTARHMWSCHKVKIIARECECMTCEIKYCTKDDLQRHIEIVHCKASALPSSFTCNLCSHSLTNVGSLKKHLHYHKFMDFKGILMICNICEYSTTSIKSMTRHMVSSHDIRMNGKECKCTTCGKKYSMKKDLQNHIEKYHRIPDPRICNICSQSFKDRKTITRHFRHHESMDFRGDSVFCKICEFSSSFVPCMIPHIQSSHGDRINASVHDCGICGRKFFNKIALSKHIVRLHPTDQLLCTMCALSFMDKVKLKKHIHYHEFVDFKGMSVFCKRCEFSCTLIKSMSLHMLFSHNIRIHAKEYKCKICGEKFLSRYMHTKHVEREHNKRVFKCKLCYKQCLTSKCLRKHERNHLQKKDLEKTIKCPVCTKMFLKKEGLAKHMRTHTGETPYKCSFCDRAFTLSQNLAAHLRLHTGDKPYKCEVCGLAFRHNVSKKNHMKYHKDVPGVVYTPPVNNRKYVKKKNNSNESDDDLPLSNLLKT